MSNERSAAGNERPTAGHARTDGGGLAASVGRTADRLAADRERIVRVAAAVAVVAVAGLTALTVARNLPFEPVALPDGLYGPATAATPVAIAGAAVAVALASRRDAVRVGLLFAGVFGLLAAVDRSAALPAVPAVVGGGALALSGAVGRPSTYREYRSAAIGALVLGGVALSLASTAGIVDPGLRGLSGTVSLAGVAAFALRTEDDWLALGAGVLGVAVVIWASATRPFVVGSALLVGFGVVNVPHLLAALAVGGAATGVVAGLRRRNWGLAAGVALLAVAGVPATAPRATAVVLGAALALGSIDGVVGPREESEIDGESGGTREGSA